MEGVDWLLDIGGLVAKAVIAHAEHLAPGNVGVEVGAVAALPATRLCLRLPNRSISSKVL
eukprot:2624475-Pleurochrysis_carterae.AAC.1